MDTLENYRDAGSDLRDYYATSISQPHERDIKVLTIISTIFMPLTFIAGIYGMNFDRRTLRLEHAGAGLEVRLPVFAGADGGRWRSGSCDFFRRKGWLGRPPPPPKPLTTELTPHSENAHQERPGRAARRASSQRNVLVDGQRIAAIDAAVHTRADEVVDAAGLHLLPGVIDDQVHFREPGLTHKEDLHTASRACAKGGVTTFLEMPNTVPTATTQERLDEKRRLAAEKSLVNYGFYIGATPHNIDDLRTGDEHAGHQDLHRLQHGRPAGGRPGRARAHLRRDDAADHGPLRGRGDRARERRAISRRRPTWPSIRRSATSPPRSIATRRAIDLAMRHRHRFHVLHVSTGDETDSWEYYAGPGRLGRG